MIVKFQVGFPRHGTSWDNLGGDILLSLCPGTKIFPCPDVPLSQDKNRSENPRTESIPNWGKNIKRRSKISKKKIKKNLIFHFFFITSFLGEYFGS